MKNSASSLSGVVAALAIFVSPALAGTAFHITKLDSDQAHKARHIDANLVNPWGVSQAPGGAPLWVSDNHTGLSTLYDQGTGKVESLVVTIPKGDPTGNVYNGTGAFQVSKNGKSGSASFIFASEAGIISGWSSGVDPEKAVIAYDGSGNGSVYKGLALDSSTEELFAADFVNNQVQVFDGNFKLVNHFTDKTLKGYAPFNVAVINGNLYVSFAKQAKTCCDEKHGPGLGAIDVFDEGGKLRQQLVATGGALNAPWGMIIAPSSFKEFAGTLLVGNFGNGRINAFDAGSGTLVGTLKNSKGRPLVIDGLWGLDPVPDNQVTFTAGPNGENHGLLGMISVAK